MGFTGPRPCGCPQIGVAADTNNNAFWASELDRYVGITRKWTDGQRIVARTESPDFQRWSKGVEVLRGVNTSLQTYAMSAFPYANVYLGLVMILNTKTDRVDCELAWSPDTVRWERVCPGTPLIRADRRAVATPAAFGRHRRFFAMA